MMMCPNCEQLMNVATKCTVCGHIDRDPDCTCEHCTKKRELNKNSK